MDEQNLKRMKELICLLNKANQAYYQENREFISNQEYDTLYDELIKLETQMGIVLSNSPTQKVGHEVLSSLPKFEHEIKMLSLDKTKEIRKLQDWLGNEKGLLSWKLDGLTIVLSYNNGQLIRGVTRGNGEIGEVVTNNVKAFLNVPLQIPYRGALLLRGEAVIRYSDFAKINEELSIEEQYKNPRNLCSGSVRQLNSEITARRRVYFYAFQLVSAEVDFHDSKKNQFLWMKGQGFDVVEYKEVSSENLIETVQKFQEQIPSQDVGSDGLVLTFDSISHSEKLGSTAKFPRHSIAYKWTDELKETKLISIQWNTSRTGLINPIAIFEPVQLEGTTVTRASVHNVSILENLKLAQGDQIQVYKANMIIPQISENLTRSGPDPLPKHCPECGGETEVEKIKDVKVLKCTNSSCSAKQLKAFSHFVSRNAMNIEGLSEATLEKFIDHEILSSFQDLYSLENKKDEIIALEGYGEKSYTNLIQSIKKSKSIPLPNFIYALGIQNVGLSNARLLCDYYNQDLKKIMEASIDEIIEIHGFGRAIAEAIYYYFQSENNQSRVNALLSYIQIKQPSYHTENKLEGKTFVITGNVEHFKNRNELKGKIISLGGKATGTVSKNTDYLINNDIQSTSSKNKKAQELGIPIITEEKFLKMIEE